MIINMSLSTVSHPEILSECNNVDNELRDSLSVQWEEVVSSQWFFWLLDGFIPLGSQFSQWEVYVNYKTLLVKNPPIHTPIYERVCMRNRDAHTRFWRAAGFNVQVLYNSRRLYKVVLCVSASVVHSHRFKNSGSCCFMSCLVAVCVLTKRSTFLFISKMRNMPTTVHVGQVHVCMFDRNSSLHPAGPCPL